MTYRSKREEIHPHYIFHAYHYNNVGTRIKHYFYCIYSELEDENNKSDLFIVGLLITTQKQDDYKYIQKVEINGKEAYVCCNDEYKFASTVKRVKQKQIVVSKKDKRNVIRCYERFMETKKSQLRKELNT